ncbi:hypothetical protein C8J57DRAFT_1605300 [Mycena rebaudengoi]|nr:hypothetical protein C8J57DRAFT_1605300 [Mycena rebaudengoi]
MRKKKKPLSHDSQNHRKKGRRQRQKKVLTQNKGKDSPNPTPHAVHTAHRPRASAGRNEQRDTISACAPLARTLPPALVAREARAKAAPAHREKCGAPTRLALQKGETSSTAPSTRTLPPVVVAPDALRKQRGARRGQEQRIHHLCGSHCTSREDREQRLGGTRRGTRRSEMQVRSSGGHAYYDEEDGDKAAIECIKLGEEGARCPSYANKKERQKWPQRPGMSAGMGKDPSEARGGRE